MTGLSSCVCAYVGGGDNLRVVIFYALPTVHNVLHWGGGGGVGKCTCVCVFVCVRGSFCSQHVQAKQQQPRRFCFTCSEFLFASIITCSFLSVSFSLVHSKNNNKKKTVDQLLLLMFLMLLLKHNKKKNPQAVCVFSPQIRCVLATAKQRQ